MKRSKYQNFRPFRNKTLREEICMFHAINHSYSSLPASKSQRENACSEGRNEKESHSCIPVSLTSMNVEMLGTCTSSGADRGGSDQCLLSPEKRLFSLVGIGQNPILQEYPLILAFWCRLGVQVDTYDYTWAQRT